MHPEVQVRVQDQGQPRPHGVSSHVNQLETTDGKPFAGVRLGVDLSIYFQKMNWQKAGDDAWRAPELVAFSNVHSDVCLQSHQCFLNLHCFCFDSSCFARCFFMVCSKWFGFEPRCVSSLLGLRWQKRMCIPGRQKCEEVQFFGAQALQQHQNVAYCVLRGEDGDSSDQGNGLNMVCTEPPANVHNKCACQCARNCVRYFVRSYMCQFLCFCLAPPNCKTYKIITTNWRAHLRGHFRWHFEQMWAHLQRDVLGQFKHMRTDRFAYLWAQMHGRGANSGGGFVGGFDGALVGVGCHSAGLLGCGQGQLERIGPLTQSHAKTTISQWI